MVELVVKKTVTKKQEEPDLLSNFYAYWLNMMLKKGYLLLAEERDKGYAVWFERPSPEIESRRVKVLNLRGNQVLAYIR